MKCKNISEWKKYPEGIIFNLALLDVNFVRRFRISEEQSCVFKMRETNNLVERREKLTKSRGFLHKFTRLLWFVDHDDYGSQYIFVHFQATERVCSSLERRYRSCFKFVVAVMKLRVRILTATRKKSTKKPLQNICQYHSAKRILRNN